MKCVIDVDLERGDCSFCPCFHRYLNSDATCGLAGEDMVGETRTCSDGRNRVVCFDRPDWCPLVLVDDYLVERLLETRT